MSENDWKVMISAGSLAVLCELSMDFYKFITAYSYKFPDAKKGHSLHCKGARRNKATPTTNEFRDREGFRAEVDEGKNNVPRALSECEWFEFYVGGLLQG